MPPPTLPPPGRPQGLARLVAQHFGGVAAREEDLRAGWLQASAAAKVDSRSIAIPLGALTAGTSRHRALLFKLLADALNVRCQLVKGKFFGGSEESSINMVTVAGQQYLLDLVSTPGRLVHPEEYATLARPGGPAGARRRWPGCCWRWRCCW
jgi:serine/threonine-protein kinase CTR1